MAIPNNTPANFAAYLKCYPHSVQTRLKQMRSTIKKAAPRAQETISYGIPAFTLDGILVYFAAFKNHIGLYPRASGIAAFKKELSTYKNAKGSVQFPHNHPLPLALITRIVKYRVRENLARKKK